MRGSINDCLRRLIGLGVRVLGFGLASIHRINILTFFWNQRRLRWRYGIVPDTPVLGFGPELEKLIQEAGRRAGTNIQFALTSGSTAQPKRILFTKERLRAVKLAYIDMFARCCWSLRIARTSLFVFSSFSGDSSLTSLLLNEEEKLPGHLSLLQAPYRVQSQRVMRSLACRYGATAVRLWIMAIANPAILYSTNPSTLSSFLERLDTEWPLSSRLIKDWCEKPEAFHPEFTLIAKRLDSAGSTSRLRRIAKSDFSLPLGICVPAIQTLICWTGGYVQPFLERIKEYLPPDRYRLIPMYSMSTESIETVSHFIKGSVSFLPLASGVLYEFLEEGLADRPENLRNADQLQKDRKYTMLVSDSYGLRRYQTNDLFLCKGYEGGLPDLSFVGRRGLEYSFTGEKLTAAHVSQAFQRLRAESAVLAADQFLTCVPCQPMDESKPHYRIIHIGEGASLEQTLGHQLAIRFDELLREINCEYRSKRESGRLAPARFARLTLREFINGISKDSDGQSWETQFKFLPLYKHAWNFENEVNRCHLVRNRGSSMLTPLASETWTENSKIPLRKGSRT